MILLPVLVVTTLLSYVAVAQQNPQPAAGAVAPKANLASPPGTIGGGAVPQVAPSRPVAPGAPVATIPWSGAVNWQTQGGQPMYWTWGGNWGAPSGGWGGGNFGGPGQWGGYPPEEEEWEGPRGGQGGRGGGRGRGGRRRGGRRKGKGKYRGNRRGGGGRGGNRGDWGGNRGGGGRGQQEDYDYEYDYEDDGGRYQYENRPWWNRYNRNRNG